MPIETLDVVVIAVYVVAIVGLGCWAGLRKHSRENAGDYFLAGKSLRWPVIGLALFATNISTVHLVSLGGRGLHERPGLRQFRVDGAVHTDCSGAILRSVLHPRQCRDAARFSGEALQSSQSRLAGAALDHLGDLHPHWLFALRRGHGPGRTVRRPEDVEHRSDRGYHRSLHHGRRADGRGAHRIGADDRSVDRRDGSHGHRFRQGRWLERPDRAGRSR